MSVTGAPTAVVATAWCEAPTSAYEDGRAPQVRVVHPDSLEAPAHRGLLAVVCDGTGSHAAGAVAARLAVETIVGRYARSDDRHDPKAVLERCVQAANRALCDCADTTSAPRVALRATCTAFVVRGGAAYCAHVGDSRLYLARGGSLFQMTEDHSAAMQLAREGLLHVRDAPWHADDQVLSRALGQSRALVVSSWPRAFAVRPGDRFLLCTRSLHNGVPESVLQRALGVGTPGAGCSMLIELARTAGARDPVAVVIVSF